MEMSVLLKNCYIFDFHSPFHKMLKDLLISDDGMMQFADQVQEGIKTYDLEGAWVCPGFCDMMSNFCEPGNEYKEDIETGTMSAIYGGFTDVCLLPNNDPVTDTKSGVEFIRSKSRQVDLHPIAALGLSAKCENLTEILDLKDAGVVAFSNGHLPISSGEFLMKALQYMRHFDGLIISRSANLSLSMGTHMHEGVMSTTLGLRGEPSISEKIHLGEQLDILRYTGGRIHFSLVSSAGGVEMIRNAKREGLNVTCDVGVNHMVFTDEHLFDFDTNYKVSPPFRSEQDRKALIEGVNDGTIDAIVTSHEPQDKESKFVEFDMAKFGIISLQTAFSTLISIQEELDIEKAICSFTHGSRSILKQSPIVIEEGCRAKLAIFDPEMKWTLDASTSMSKSWNSPFWGKELTGKCIGIINGKKTYLNL